ncbi:hypothetical protein NPIL_580491, partial [Nephila pilipes]
MNQKSSLRDTDKVPINAETSFFAGSNKKILYIERFSSGTMNRMSIQ